MELHAGQRLDDRYVLAERLGRGGQGEVWRVEDSLRPGTPRAVKLMSVTEVGTAQIERVRREAKQLVQLEHPSLVTCHGLFEDVRQEVMGLVMDYVEGQALDSLVDDPRLTEEHRLSVLGHVAGVLAYVHQRAVVHRDIKLENVLLGSGFWAAPADPRHLKMIDFGIAASSGNPQPLTLLGHVIGTPGYMPPEVVDPEYWSAERSRPAGDVFAWGVLAWRLLMQGHPSGLGKASLQELATVYRQVHEARREWPVGLPPTRWAPVVARALSLDAARRPQNGLALLQLLQQQVPVVASITVPQTARTPALGQLVEPAPETAPTVPDGVVRPDESPTVADRSATVGPDDATFRAPLHLQPTLLAPAPAPVPNVEPSPLSAQLPSKRHLAVALVATVVVTAVLFLGLIVALVVMVRGRGINAGGSPLEAVAKDDGASSNPAPATTCASGVSCEPSCGALLDNEAQFELRFTYVQLERGAIQQRYPEAEVCTAIAGKRREVCTAVAETQRTRFAREYLTATHADLAQRGLDIRVRERPGGAILASTSAARPRYGVIKRSALCRGYVVSGPFQGAESVLHATYFIHPARSPAAR